MWEKEGERREMGGGGGGGQNDIQLFWNKAGGCKRDEGHKQHRENSIY